MRVYLQLDRIKNIGSLPCLEKLNLSSNPMCIIPDYRTKVLAQFGDRAAEVLPSLFILGTPPPSAHHEPSCQASEPLGRRRKDKGTAEEGTLSLAATAG